MENLKRIYHYKGMLNLFRYNKYFVIRNDFQKRAVCSLCIISKNKQKIMEWQIGLHQMEWQIGLHQTLDGVFKIYKFLVGYFLKFKDYDKQIKAGRTGDIAS